MKFLKSMCLKKIGCLFSNFSDFLKVFQPLLTRKPVLLNLSWFVALFQRLSTLVTPYSSMGFCNIRTELFSKGFCSWPPENFSVIPKRGRRPRLRKPAINN